jgi:ATP-dependent protease ClpP protease subunit
MKALFLALVFGCASVPAQARSAPENIVGAVDAVSLSDLADKINAADPGDFPLYFNSPGGSVFEGLDFLRVMEAAQARGVRFVCTADLAASMGAVLYSACDVRLALPRALFLIHGASFTVRGNARDLRESAAALEAVSDAMYLQIARVLNIPFDELKRQAAGSDYWLDSAHAAEIGLVHAVLP